ncbi:hypothetical protein Sste5346_003101 [Sporothrix stenoceras]|uniref:Kinetochore protein mis14 n=1 Tax=Sporothrix stenoceras TaxID=5173 RepID=A0ABR3ZI18_9PEZI
MEAAHHRKIELQAPEDFAYLVDNVRRAAADSVAAAFPPVANEDDNNNEKAVGKNGKKKKRVEEDDLHTRVEALVNEYIRRAFALAAPNLTINGLPVDPAPFWDDEDDDSDSNAKGKKGKKGKKNQAPVEETEPFDTRKRQRVEDLSRDEEDLLRDIALLKRRVPAAAVRAREQALAGQLAADDAAAAALQEVLQQQQEVAAAAAREEAEAEAENADTASSAASFAQAVAGLGRLKQAMPATVARMERARVAGDYAVAER